MKKLKSYLFLSLLGLASANAQLVTNKTNVVISSGLAVHVNGGFTNVDNGANQGVVTNNGNLWIKDGSAGFNGDFTNQTGADAILSNGSILYVARNFTNSATLTANDGSLIHFNGTSNQSVSDNQNTSLYNVKIDNSVGGDLGVEVMATGPLRVRNNIDFTNGKVIANSNTGFFHTIGSATITNYNSSKYFVGYLKRELPASGSIDFPIGALPSGKGYQLANLNFTSKGDYQNLLANFIPSDAGTVNTTAECGNNGYDGFLENGRWNFEDVVVAADKGTYSITVYPTQFNSTLYAAAGVDYTNGTGNASATVQKSPSGAATWALDGNCDYTSDLKAAIPFVKRNAITTGFSEFVVAVDLNLPFPVEMLPLTASANNINKSIDLNWKTLSETNNFGFEIERSEDGINFAKLAQNAFVAGHGTTQTPQNYQFTDADVQINKTYFYKLRQIDVNGGFKFSNIASAILDPSGINFSVYPNPFNENLTLKIVSPSKSDYTIEVYNTIGQKLWYNNLVVDGQQEVSLPANSWTTGTYQVVLKGNDFVKTVKVVKQ